MAQSQRRGVGQRTQKSIGGYLFVALFVVLFLARNYYFPSSPVVPTVPAEATAQPIPTQVTLPTADPQSQTENVSQAGNEQKSDLPPLASAGSNQEKKATRTPTPKPRASPTKRARATATATPKPAKPTATATSEVLHSQSGLPLIDYEELPREARDTIKLIDKGGPFPFSRDGVEFQNRERLLPRKGRGYYQEYTVITPGSDDRGARRIIAGENGELYYTDDHYDSFQEVVR